MFRRNLFWCLREPLDEILNVIAARVGSEPPSTLVNPSIEPSPKGWSRYHKLTPVLAVWPSVADTHIRLPVAEDDCRTLELCSRRVKQRIAPL